MTFSPGNYHEQVPRTLVVNLNWRLRLLRAVKAEGKQVGLARKALRKACKEDILFWINAFVYQFNPKEKRPGHLAMGPFLTWPFQEDALRMMLWCIQHDEDLLIEKSRQMGGSWLLLLCMDWLFLFHDWKTLLVISRDEKAVEAKHPNSLFWKIDFIHQHLPSWLLPKAMKRRKMYFGNDDLGSSIGGEASTGKAGVGGNVTAMGIDEFSQIDDDREVLHRTSNTTGCRIFNGTHLGLDTAFYELSCRPDMKKLQMHWTQHPVYARGLYRFDEMKNQVEVLDKEYVFPAEYEFIRDGTPKGGPQPGIRSPWYDDQCRKKGDGRAIAMDLDINPEGSVSQFFDMTVIHSLKFHFCRPPTWQGEIEYDPDTAIPLRFTPRKDGALKLWLQLDPRTGFPPKGTYGAACDPSAGQGATPTCMSIADCVTGEKIAEYTNAWIDPTPFAACAVALCRAFCTEDNIGAMFVWEIPGPGLALGKKVIELGYRQIYYRHREDKLTHKLTDTWGFASNTNAQRLLLEHYRDALKTRQFLNRSAEALEECKFFKWDGRGNVVHGIQDSRKGGEANPSGAGCNHGDHVMADAMCWLVTKQFYVETRKQVEETPGIGSLAWRRMLAEQERPKSRW